MIRQLLKKLFERPLDPAVERIISTNSMTNANDLVSEAHELFDHYTLGPMNTNCDPDCCPRTEVNDSLLLPLASIPEDHLLDYYHGGPNQIGELTDYKHFIPVFAEKLFFADWETWPITIAIEHSDESDWTKEEISWLIRFFASVGEQRGNKRKFAKAFSFLLKAEEAAMS